MFERERREARERAAQPVDRPRAPVRRRSVVLASPEAEAPTFATGPLPSPPITRIRRRGATSAEAGAEVGADGGEISADTSRSIEQARGGGRPLDGDVRHQMEAGFGADFSAVRVHSDARAAALNERVQADAFTIGSDIFLRQPVLDTSSPGGQHLLAHELAHTIQQGAVPAATQVSRQSVAPVVQRGRKKRKGDQNTTGGANTTVLDRVDDQTTTAPQDGGVIANVMSSVWSMASYFWSTTPTPTPTADADEQASTDDNEQQHSNEETSEESAASDEKQEAVDDETVTDVEQTAQQTKAPTYSQVRKAETSARNTAADVLQRAKAVKVDAAAVTAALQALDKAQPVPTLGRQKKTQKALNRERDRLWAAVQVLEAKIETVQESLDQANEKDGKIYGGKTKQAVLISARQVAQQANALRVDVEALQAELDKHGPLDEGEVPDYHELLASLPRIEQLANTATPKFVVPARCAKISKKRVTDANAAIKEADATLDGDPDHPRDSEYWKHLRQYQGWVQSAVDTYEKVVAAKYPVWEDAEKELKSMELWTPHVLLERHQGQAHVEKRVGLGGVAIDVARAADINGDGKDDEAACLIETLNRIPNGQPWKGLGGGKWGAYHGNLGRDLPAGNYSEYYVRPPQGTPKHEDGLRRVVVGDDGRRWYTWTHYGDKGQPAFVLLRGYGGVT